MSEIMVLVPLSKILVVEDNQGGYKAVRCVLCGKADWETRFSHEETCPAHPNNLPNPDGL